LTPAGPRRVGRTQAYEFVDTVIMVLKKNNRQISFLHVYHHATTFFPVWWANVKFGPGGEAYFCCAFNSFIHVLMYVRGAAPVPLPAPRMHCQRRFRRCQVAGSFAAVACASAQSRLEGAMAEPSRLMNSTLGHRLPCA
jgi:hypothetical protein